MRITLPIRNANHGKRSPAVALVAHQQGLSLLEVVISIAVLGILLAGFIPALLGATHSVISVDERETAKNLAESQMEYVKGLLYASDYEPASIPAPYSGYSVDITAGNDIPGRDSNLQRIVVTVTHSGREVYRLEGYKVR